MRLRSLPKWARKFAEEYVESEALWYLTKGGLLSRRTLKKLQAQLRQTRMSMSRPEVAESASAACRAIGMLVA